MSEVADWSDVEAAAKVAAGNWKKFQSFAWHEKPEDAENWVIVYTENRDSDNLAKSNSAAITKELEPFILEEDGEDETVPNRKGRDVIPQRHNHWACGWVDGFAIRVYESIRHHKCQCGTEWCRRVVLSDHTRNISGEATEFCRGCGGRAMYSSPRMTVVTAAFKKWCEIQAKLADYPVLDEEDYSEREYEECLENIMAYGRKIVLDCLDDDYWPAKVFGELNASHPDDIREKDVVKAIVDLGMCKPEELPKFPFSAHVRSTIRNKVSMLSDTDARSILNDVIEALAGENGRPVLQIEEAEHVLKRHELWPSD